MFWDTDKILTDNHHILHALVMILEDLLQGVF